MATSRHRPRCWPPPSSPGVWSGRSGAAIVALYPAAPTALVVWSAALVGHARSRRASSPSRSPSPGGPHWCPGGPRSSADLLATSPTWLAHRVCLRPVSVQRRAARLPIDDGSSCNLKAAEHSTQRCLGTSAKGRRTYRNTDCERSALSGADPPRGRRAGGGDVTRQAATPATTPAVRPAVPPGRFAASSSIGPSATGTSTVGEVIDLDSARRVRRSSQQLTGWACPECDLTAGPFEAAEASMLATLHDQVLRHPPRTAIPHTVKCSCSPAASAVDNATDNAIDQPSTEAADPAVDH